MATTTDAANILKQYIPTFSQEDKNTIKNELSVLKTPEEKQRYAQTLATQIQAGRNQFDLLTQDAGAGSPYYTADVEKGRQELGANKLSAIRGQANFLIDQAAKNYDSGKITPEQYHQAVTSLGGNPFAFNNPTTGRLSLDYGIPANPLVEPNKVGAKPVVRKAQPLTANIGGKQFARVNLVTDKGTVNAFRDQQGNYVYGDGSPIDFSKLGSIKQAVIRTPSGLKTVSNKGSGTLSQPGKTVGEAVSSAINTNPSAVTGAGSTVGTTTTETGGNNLIGPIVATAALGIPAVGLLKSQQNLKNLQGELQGVQNAIAGVKGLPAPGTVSTNVVKAGEQILPKVAPKLLAKGSMALPLINAILNIPLAADLAYNTIRRTGDIFTKGPKAAFSNPVDYTLFGQNQF